MIMSAVLGLTQEHRLLGGQKTLLIGPQLFTLGYTTSGAQKKTIPKCSKEIKMVTPVKYALGGSTKFLDR